MQPKDVNNLKMNIYATMAYFDIFDFPLTIEEIGKYLLWANADRNELWTFLNNDPGIQRYGDFYFFKGRRAIVDVRRDREEVSERFWKKVRRFVPLVQFVPFIRMAAVCNTLAINNAARDSDIDLFVVAKSGRLFFARTLLTLMFGLLGVRRHGKKVAGRFCLSFYVTDENLNLENIRLGSDDIYLPFWLVTMKPLYGRETYEKLLAENGWIKKYFPRPMEKCEFWMENRSLKAIARVKEKVWEGKMGNRIEAWLAAMQYKRYHRNIKKLGPEASVIVSEKMLKFHNVDRRSQYAQRFRQRFEEMMEAV
jgi:hypothetical protein